MSVILETSLGDITIDLYTSICPVTCKNFLKLCKIKYYNNCLFHNIQKDFLIQTGDPTNTGKGGDSIYGLLYGEQAKFFEDEILPTLKHTKKGTVAMGSAGPNLNASQFYITVQPGLHQLDEKHTIFGEVAEGFETIDKINEVYTDAEGRPKQVVRIKHTIILDDPFPDPEGLQIPDQSPLPPKDKWADLLDEEEIDQLGKPDSRPPEEIEQELKDKEAQSREDVLVMIGDISEPGVKPPDSVLFVCKLNPVTTEEDLEIIFSRFGEIRSCEVIRDWKTGDSLSYAFIEFATPEQCEQAFFKMDNVLIDDRRIHVDFSQSVSKLVKGKDGKTVRLMNRNVQSFGKSTEPSAASSKGKSGSSSSNVHIKKSATPSAGNYSMVFDKEDERKDSKRKRDDHRRSDQKSRSSRDDHYRDRKRDSPQRRRSRSRSPRRSPRRRR